MENTWHIESTLKKILGIITIILRRKKKSDHKMSL